MILTGSENDCPAAARIETEQMVRHRSWRPTGFTLSATGLGVSGTLIESDALICQKLVDYVDDKRFMRAAPRDEIGAHVLESVQNVRRYSVSAQHLPSSRTAQEAIKEVARACRTYVDTMGGAPDQQLLEVGLQSLRKRIGTSVVALVEKYNLDCDLELSEFVDDALDVLQRWMKIEPYRIASGEGDEVNPE